jgi:hypothetical protein
MSDKQRSRAESEGHRTFDFKNSRELTVVSDFNLNKDFLFTSLSTGTPTDLQPKKKKSLSESEKVNSKEIKKLEKENMSLQDYCKKVK